MSNTAARFMGHIITFANIALDEVRVSAPNPQDAASNTKNKDYLIALIQNISTTAALVRDELHGSVPAPAGPTNREVHEAAAGYGLSDSFFAQIGVDPAAPVAPASPEAAAAFVKLLDPADEDDEAATYPMPTGGHLSDAEAQQEAIRQAQQRPAQQRPAPQQTDSAPPSPALALPADDTSTARLRDAAAAVSAHVLKRGRVEDRGLIFVLEEALTAYAAHHFPPAAPAAAASPEAAADFVKLLGPDDGAAAYAELNGIYQQATRARREDSARDALLNDLQLIADRAVRLRSLIGATA